MLALLLSLGLGFGSPTPIVLPELMVLDGISLDLQGCSSVHIIAEADALAAGYAAAVASLGDNHHPDDPCPCGPGGLIWDLMCPPGKVQAPPDCFVAYTVKLQLMAIDAADACHDVLDSLEEKIQQNLDLDLTSILTTCSLEGTSAAQAEIQDSVDAAIVEAWADVCAERAQVAAQWDAAMDEVRMQALDRCCIYDEDDPPWPWPVSLDLQGCSAVHIAAEANQQVADYVASLNPGSTFARDDDPCPCNSGDFVFSMPSCGPGHHEIPVNCLDEYYAMMLDAYESAVDGCFEITVTSERIHAELDLDITSVLTTCSLNGTSAAQAEIDAAVAEAIEDAWQGVCADRAASLTAFHNEITNLGHVAILRCCQTE